MRVDFDRTLASQGNGGRRTEPFFTRSSRSAYLPSHHVTMSYQIRPPSWPTADTGCRRQSFFLGITCGCVGCGRCQGRSRSSVSRFCCYIAAVVLLQNALMAYNVARQASQDLVGTYYETTSNWTLKLSGAIVANSHVSSSNQRVSLVRPNTMTNSSFGALQERRMYYRTRTTKVNPYKHQVLLVPAHLCDANTLMVILVHSGTRNVDQRAAIRETWGNAASTGRWPNEQETGSCVGLRLAFVLGLHADKAVNNAIREEHSRYNDIAQGDFIDHYHNMTLKSLLGLKVLDERCPGVRYLLKTDDDMIVNLPYLLLLLANKKLQWSIMGPVNVGARAHRGGKWKLTKEEFPFVFFPPYESGSAYIITGDLIHELFVTAEYVPHIFVDDVYITGILGRILGVNHVVHRGFAFWHSRPPLVCDIVSNRVVAGTKMTPALLRTVWKQLYKPVCSVSVHTLRDGSWYASNSKIKIRNSFAGRRDPGLVSPTAGLRIFPGFVLNLDVIRVCQFMCHIVMGKHQINFK